MPAKVFAVLGRQSEGHQRLFRLLSDFFKVRFEAVAGDAPEAIAGLIALDGEQPFTNSSRVGSGHAYIVSPSSRTDRPSHQTTVRFSDSSQLPACLRGLTLQTPEAGDVQLLDDSSGEVLATVADLPVWTLSRSNGHFRHRVSLPLPELTRDQCLSDFLNGDRFLSLLPLFHFLRVSVGASEWSPPPLRACAVIDDPNLHWTSYGRLNYRRLLSWAKEAPFHVSMATIPLDAFWVSSSASRLFRENERWLSLLVHGNDHSLGELAQPLPVGQRLAALARALQRIQALERKAGIRVARVMAPPHGHCTEAYMRVMPRLGLEGLTTTRSALWLNNPSAHKPAWASLELADCLVDNFPVLMRFQFRAANAEARIAVSAFLGQPLIPYGHHTDFAEEGSSFRRVVEVINRLPGVEWMDPGQVLQSNFYRMFTGDTLHIKMFSRKVRVEIPEGTRQLVVELPNSMADSLREIGFSLREVQGSVCSHNGIEVRVSPSSPKGAVLELTPQDAIDPSRVRGSRTPVSAGLRRLATEMRDRLLA